MSGYNIKIGGAYVPIDNYLKRRTPDGTETTGLTKYHVNGVDLINYFVPHGTTSNLRYTATTKLNYGLTPVDINTAFELKLISSSSNITYTETKYDTGVMIKITQATNATINFSCNIINMKVLLVGGGGGGGACKNIDGVWNAGGGGGAGEVRHGTITTLNTNIINSINVGSGGVNSVFTGNVGEKGNTTSFVVGGTTYSAYGGGGGGHGNQSS